MHLHLTMRSILLFACCLLQLTAFAQKREQAILPECDGAESGPKCTRLAIETGVKELITDDIVQELRAAGLGHFTVSWAFITDADGKVVPKDTGVLCENKTLENRTRTYLDNLPVFLPKHNSLKERRSVHISYMTFIYDETSQKYIEATAETLNEKGIKPEMVPLDKPFIYPGCEGATAQEHDACSKGKLYEYIVKRYKVPPSDVAGTVKMMAKFIINADGEIVVDTIEGGSSPFRKELQRVLKKLPDVKPAEMRGIPIRISYTLPVTINIQ